MCRSHRECGHRFASLLIAFFTVLFPLPAFGQDPSPDPLDALPANPILLLSVRVNGWPLGLVARFIQDGDRLWIPAAQFDGLRFDLDQAAVTEVDGERRVYLDELPGVTWQIDTANQTIDITAPFDLLQPNVLRLNPGVARIESRSNWGGMLAYNFYGEYSSRPQSDLYARTASIDVEARLFSPIFVASTHGYYSIAEGDDGGEFVRLESTVDFDNVEKAWRLRLGDSITVGPAWLRTIRFGGVQWGTEFGLRPDLVTTPMPVLNQDVSVPSTIDVFVNETRRFSQAVDPGAIRLTDLPVAAGTNRIRVVVTDQAGRRTELFLPLYSSIDLLAEDLWTFNLEAGAERQQYAVESNDYGPVFASGALGFGVSDRLTARGYGAAADGYWMGALGTTFAIGNFLLAEATGMYSQGPAGDGWAWYGSVEHVSQRLNLFASYMHATTGFRDLAGHFGYTVLTDQAIFSGGLNMDRFGTLNVAYVMQRELDGDLSRLLSGTYGLDLFDRQVHLSLSGYVELTESDWGTVVSLTFPLGRNAQVYAEHNWRNGVLSSRASARGQGWRERFDWEISGEQGELDEVYVDAGWDGELIDARLHAAGSHGEYGVRGELSQSLVFMDGRLSLAGRIDDGFAIVEVENMPGVRVSLENRVVGRTGRGGRLFVTGLNSYIGNAISIDPLDLPIDASIGDVSMLVAPRAGGGTVARFPVSRESSALAVILLPDGTPPPAGAQVALEGSDLPAVVGYDGEVYLRGLSAGTNRLTISWRDGQCQASFTVEVASGTLPRLGPFTCAP